jgi:hypothetical protein
LALEKSEHDPNIFSGIFSKGFVFKVSRQMRSGSFAPYSVEKLRLKRGVCSDSM